MEPINLTDDQRLYLQDIFDYFHIEGKWPTHKYLERRFIQTHPDLDIDEIVQSVPSGFTNPVKHGDTDSKAILSIPAMYLCQDSKQDLENFVFVLCLCVKGYFDPNQDELQISSDSLNRRYPDKERLTRQVGLLLHLESGIWGTFSTIDDVGSWKYTIDRRIRRFRDVKTIEQYLEEKKRISNKSSSEAIQPANEPLTSSVVVSAEELQLHPDLLSKCWDLYTVSKYDDAILNATKALEVAVRTKAKLSQSCVGVDVINAAFSLKKPLLRYSKIDAEQEGMMSLLRGIIQVFKNPHSHRFVGVQNKSECLGVLLMCSNLLYIVDNAEYVETMS